MARYKHAKKSSGGVSWVKKDERMEGSMGSPKIEDPVGGKGVQESKVMTDAYMASITTDLYNDRG